MTIHLPEGSTLESFVNGLLRERDGAAVAFERLRKLDKEAANLQREVLDLTYERDQARRAADAASRREFDLSHRVAQMRALGVIEWEGDGPQVIDGGPPFRWHVVLGPEPSAPIVSPKPRTAEEQAKISKSWKDWRAAEEQAQIDGTEIPDQPDEPERDPAT